MATDNAPINLMRGWPAPRLLPAEILREAANNALADPTISVPGLSYGPDEGYEPFRVALAAWLTDFYNPTAGAVTASRLAITGGASQSLGVLLSVFADPYYTRAIWAVTPAYYLSFPIFRDAGFADKVRAVPEGEDGVDIIVLEDALSRSEKQARRENVDAPRYKSRNTKVYKHVIYCVPAFSNPSSRTMSRGKREALVRLARKYDALVVCDDVYDFLQWQVSPEGVESDPLGKALLPRIVDVDRLLDSGPERIGADGWGNVVSNGSCSKIAGPGLRSGWCESTTKFAFELSKAGVTMSGGNGCQLTSTYITLLLQSGALQDHVRRVLCPAYAKRYTILSRAIKTHLIKPLGFSITAPQSIPTDHITTAPSRRGMKREILVAGGFFIWVTLPSTLRGAALAQRCQREANVTIANGEMFEVHDVGRTTSKSENTYTDEEKGTRFPHNIRLCFAWLDENLIEEGVRRIAAVARSMIEELKSKARLGSDDTEYVLVGDEESETHDRNMNDYK